jgi:hypothetical protein
MTYLYIYIALSIGAIIGFTLCAILINGKVADEKIVAYDRGWNEGFEEGFDKGHDLGYGEGINEPPDETPHLLTGEELKKAIDTSKRGERF